MRNGWKEDEVAYLIANYPDTPTRTMVAVLGRSKKSVYAKAMAIGLVKNGHPGFQFPEHLRKYPVPDDFLAPMNRSTAYLCGLLLADGCISKEGKRFSLAGKDQEHLRETLDACKLSQPLGLETRGPFTGYKATFVCKRSTQRLIDIGITARKSLNARLPIIPSEFFDAFLRGYFDGDGGVYHSYRGGLRIKFTSGSNLLLEDFRSAIRFAVGVDGSDVKSDKGRGAAFRLWYYGDRAKRIAEFMYRDGGVCLPRKREVFARASSCQLPIAA